MKKIRFEGTPFFKELQKITLKLGAREIRFRHSKKPEIRCLKETRCPKMTPDIRFTPENHTKLGDFVQDISIKTLI